MVFKKLCSKKKIMFIGLQEKKMEEELGERFGEENGRKKKKKAH